MSREVITVIQETDVDTLRELEDMCWGPAVDTIREAIKNGVEDEVFDRLYEYAETSSDAREYKHHLTLGELNDILSFDEEINDMAYREGMYAPPEEEEEEGNEEEE